MAHHFVRAGAAVALVARTHSTLEITKDEILRDIPDAESRVAVFAVDVRDVEAAERVVRETVKRFGGLDVLVAGASTLTEFTTRT
jgi:NADP-dependent 3-hydroxy acid dehydrogenase YdfG